MNCLIYKKGEGFIPDTIHEPKILPGGLLLKIESCSISDIDIRTFSNTENVKEDTIPGTQFSGVVTAVSEENIVYSVGDRLAVCMEGEPAGSGGMAQYAFLSQEILRNGRIVKIPDNVSFNEAAVADVASAVYKCQEQYGFGPGNKVLIIGCGPAGCMHTQIGKLRGVDSIIQTDCLPGRLEMARPFRADLLVDSSSENLSEIVASETGGNGVDIAVITSPDAQIMSTILPLMAEKGKIVIFSRFVNPDAQLDFGIIQKKELSVCGTDGYERKHLEAVLNLAGRRKISMKWLVTKESDLYGVDKALEEIRDGKQLKVVLHP